MADVVKQQVAAHWNRRAPGFDEDFGHSIRTAAERAAWDRILNLVLPAGGRLDALDAGCGTGFLTFELAGRGHRVHVGFERQREEAEIADRLASAYEGLTYGYVPHRSDRWKDLAYALRRSIDYLRGLPVFSRAPAGFWEYLAGLRADSIVPIPP